MVKRTPSHEENQNMRKTRRWKTALFITLAFALSTGLWTAALWVTGNVHTVEEGVFYRSGQLSADHLAATIKRYGIRTIINLRGAAPGQQWYEQEIATARNLGVVHIDLSMSADEVPDAETLARLILYMRESPKPILAHCKAGADRSGLASALYLLAIRHKPPTEAAAQLSFWYGHFPWLYSKTAAMDSAFEKLTQSPFN